MAELAAGTGVPVVLMHSRRARAVHDGVSAGTTEGFGMTTWPGT